MVPEPSACEIEERPVKSLTAIVLLVLLACVAIWAQNARQKTGGKTSAPDEKINKQTSGAKTPAVSEPVRTAVEKGARWLASVQGPDGGWGQDGGSPSDVRQSVA